MPCKRWILRLSIKKFYKRALTWILCKSEKNRLMYFIKADPACEKEEFDSSLHVPNKVQGATEAQ